MILTVLLLSSVLGKPLVRSHGREFPPAVAGRDDLHERKTVAGHRILERLADRLFALAHVGRRMHALARDVGRAVQMGHHLGDLVGIAVQPRIAPVGSRRGLHAQEGGRSHLAAGHAVDRIVDGMTVAYSNVVEA